MPLVLDGVVPLVVYRIVAPAVVELIATVWAEVYVPGAGSKTGAATVVPEATLTVKSAEVVFCPSVAVKRRT